MINRISGVVFSRKGLIGFRWEKIKSPRVIIPLTNDYFFYRMGIFLI